MINIPINVNWNNYGFRYLVSIGDLANTDNQYGYIVREKSFIGEHSHAGEAANPREHITDYVQILNSNIGNVFEKDGSYYPVSDQWSEEFLPEIIKTRKITLYIPWFKIDNYTNTDYLVKFATWMSGVEVIIGSYTINRDMYRSTPYKIYKEGRYAEIVDLYVVDPWSLMYEDEWGEWRKMICGEPDGLNNQGSPLNISIIPISETSSHYNIIQGSDIGSANVILSDNSDFMHLDLDFVKESSDLSISLHYNKTYPNILEYLKETYLIDIQEDNISTRYSIAISDNNDDLGVIDGSEEDPEEYTKNLDKWNEYLDTLDPEERQKEEEAGYLGSKWIESIIFHKSDIGIEDWSEYKIGMYLYGCIEILDGEDTVFNIVSDPMPLDPDVYKYLIKTDLDDKPIKLSNVDMLNYTIHAVNKINKNIVQVENAKDYKSNIIRPVFFRAYDINDTVIHPEVTENICLNLNGYKSKVDLFYVKIEGVIFQEISRNHNGVIFKVQGNLLPHEVEEGIIYVLNADKEMVTTGKFKYIS